MTLDTTRHSGIFDASQQSITLIGAGGIGALTALVLAKMGVGHMTVYDHDTVDDVNIATQFHRPSDIGTLKVRALRKTVDEFSGLWLEPRAFPVEADTEIQDLIVISALDSIKARKGVWEAVKAHPPLWYLDARMAAEEVHLFAVDMQEPDWYDAELGQTDENNIAELPCTAKATIYCAAFSAGHLGHAVKRIANGEPLERHIVHNIPSHRILAF
jgi:glycine/D-amino acid oxidase-like deaminating enzyme